MNAPIPAHTLPPEDLPKDLPKTVTTGPVTGSVKAYAAPRGRPDLRVPYREIALTDPGEARVRVLSGVELDARDAPPDHTQIEAAAREAMGTLRLGGPLDNQPWLGARPSTPDGLPVIGRAPRHPGLIFAFGHGHIGLSTGPVTGQIVADLATDRPPRLPLEPFAPERLLRWPRL